jgi:aerobic-type carbon monoxide dehydrogenase small subunit (CoxS/CutS family)
MTAVALTVNGKAVTGDVDPRTLLVQFLRENLRLTGTHVGCDTSQCGACVVHVDGKAVKSCTVFVWQVEGANVTTIEGLADPNGPLHPMQEATARLATGRNSCRTPGSRADNFHRCTVAAAARPWRRSHNRATMREQ